jgi:HSP20 family protein
MQRVIYLRRPLHRHDQRGLQQQLERAFQSQLPQPNALIVITQKEIWQPPTDVYETDAAIVVRVELAGMRDAEIAITLDERGLRIEGQRSERHDERPLSYHQMGINYGAFAVEVFLARPFDHDRVAARYDDGFLFVELPNPADQSGGTRVQVQIAE